MKKQNIFLVVTYFLTLGTFKESLANSASTMAPVTPPPLQVISPSVTGTVAFQGPRIEAPMPMMDVPMPMMVPTMISAPLPQPGMMSPLSSLKKFSKSLKQKGEKKGKLGDLKKQKGEKKGSSEKKRLLKKEGLKKISSQIQSEMRLMPPAMMAPQQKMMVANPQAMIAPQQDMMMADPQAMMAPQQEMMMADPQAMMAPQQEMMMADPQAMMAPQQEMMMAGQ